MQSLIASKPRRASTERRRQLLADKLAYLRASERLLPFVEYTRYGWQSGAHHARICEALEAVERGEIKRLLIEAPPRHSKSELASRRFPAWWLGRHPEQQVISASYNDALATDIGRDVRNLVREPAYSKTFPGVGLAADSTAAGRWHTAQGGSYLATGVGGTMTGYGAHLAVIDDPIKNREEADSQRVRDAVWDWYVSTLYTRLMPGGAIVMMMTRWHEDDLAARALASEDWHRLTLPAISTDAEGNESALWPAWYPLEELHRIRDVLPARDWHSLYMQEPRAEQGTYCQREWFANRYDKAPDPLNVYIVSDLAVTEPGSGRDPDYTEHGVFGLGADDTLYVLDWWSGQVTADVWIEELLRLVKRWSPVCWFGEGGVIARATEPLLRRTMRERRIYCRTEYVTPINDKEIRGRAFQGRAHAGRVRFPAGEAWADRVIEQCVRFPGGRHDDAFDVMAWMGLVLDQAHPALAKREAKAAPLDRWRRKEPAARSWKVV